MQRTPTSHTFLERLELLLLREYQNIFDNKYEDLREKRMAKKLMEEEIAREEFCKYCDYPDECEICQFRY